MLLLACLLQATPFTQLSALRNKRLTRTLHRKNLLVPWQTLLLHALSAPTTRLLKLFTRLPKSPKRFIVRHSRNLRRFTTPHKLGQFVLMSLHP